VLQREEVRRLLGLHAQAYALLLWLADAANRDPELLSPAALAMLEDPEQVPLWLERHRDRIPSELLGGEPGGAFAGLLASFFGTSFRVRHLEFEGRLLEARLTRGAAERAASTAGVEQCQMLAVRHLAASEGARLTEKEARTLVRRKSLREAALVWTYAWELDRRARNKGKGEVVHRIWRSLPKETRKSLDDERVWQARELLLREARALCEEES
jgi:hypothetical protein